MAELLLPVEGSFNTRLVYTLAMKRRFLGFEQPPIQSIVAHMLEDHAAGLFPSFDEVLLVLPSQRSGRRFLEVFLAAAISSSMTGMPRVITPGALLAETLDLNSQYPTEAERLLLWRTVCREELETVQVVLRDAPVPTTFAEWLSLGKAFDRLRRELHGNLCSCETVRHQLEEQGLDSEVQRWECIATLEKAYCARLSQFGLQDEHVHRATALEAWQLQCSALYVAGCVELPAIIKAILARAAGSAVILIAADTDAEQCFDDYGCVVPQARFSQPGLSPDAITIVDRYEDQGAAVTEYLSRHSVDVHPGDVAIACCDESSWLLLERELGDRGAIARPATGSALGDTELVLLVRAIAAYLGDPSFEHFAALCRHPAVDRHLRTVTSIEGHPVDPVAVIDRYHMRHVPATVKTPVPVVSELDEVFAALLAVIETRLEPFSASEKQIGEWSTVFIEVMAQWYPDSIEDAEAELARSSRALSDVLAALHSRTPDFIPVKAQEFLQLLLVAVQAVRIPDPGIAECIDLVGWLELQLDDSPVQIVTDAVEGCLPEARNADLFLPNSLREALELPSNARRFARDQYLLRALTRGSSQVHFIVSRKTSTGEYAFPSRFLCQSMAGQDSAGLLRLIAGEPVRFAQPHHNPTGAAKVFSLQKPDSVERIETISVTGLRTYLRCPFEYYLQHVARIETVQDRGRELDGLVFGSMLHDILDSVYRSGFHTVSDPQVLGRALDDLLDAYARDYFGSSVEPAVRVQIEQARTRLQVFARAHCDRLDSGWQVLHSEWAWEPGSVEIPLAEGTVQLRGRIDRIEQHQTTGAIAVLDYKTGDNVDRPDKAHVKGGKKSPPCEWKDLQLPAYWFAMQAYEYGNDIQLGYFILGSDLSSIGVAIADWDADMLQSGVVCLRQTAQAIVDQKFWPPKKTGHSDHPFARLFLDFSGEAEVDCDLLA